MAVVLILGVLASAAVLRLGSGSLGTLGAETDAQRIALDLRQARRRAISHGADHCVKFLSDSGGVHGYGVYRRDTGGDIAVDALREVPSHITVSPSHAQCEFSFEGQAAAAYQIDVAGGTRSWTVSVIPLTGAVRVTSN